MRNLKVVLYVDDEPINLKLFKMMFGDVFKTITSESGYEGLELLSDTEKLDLVITDLKMPGMSGLEFVKQAREIRNNVPYFLLSGYGSTIEIENALQEGLIDGYFQKPLKKSKIEEELEGYI